MPLESLVWHYAILRYMAPLLTIINLTFVGTVGVAAQTNNLFAMIGLHSIWVLLSQCMLFALLVAFLLGRHNTVIQWAKHFWHRHHKRLVFWFHVLVYTVAALFLVGTAAHVVSESYPLHITSCICSKESSETNCFSILV